MTIRMQTLALYFNFSSDPPSDDPDMSRFRQDLSRSLENALKASGTGRWRGGRFARGVVTIFIEVSDARLAMGPLHTVLASRGLADRVTVGKINRKQLRKDFI